MASTKKTQTAAEYIVSGGFATAPTEWFCAEIARVASILAAEYATQSAADRAWRLDLIRALTDLVAARGDA